MKISGNEFLPRRHHTTAQPFLVVILLVVLCTELSFGQAVRYIGAVGGIATLSADAGAQQLPQGLNLSSYAPANGGALDVFAGAHLRDYLSLQGDFIWNKNTLRLNSSSANGTFYEENRTSSQEAGIISALIYFRRRGSWIRPYLAAGSGVGHLSSASQGVVASGGTPELPPAEFSWTGPVFRTHVGMDLKLMNRLDFRYSFSETIGHNEISKSLLPPGSRGLANFQNLFGFVFRI